MRVRGVLIGRFPLVDGRPGDEPWMIRDMLAAFEPETVPILSSHGNFRLGYLHTLTLWNGSPRDMAFTGSVTDHDPGIVAELQRGVYVSLEQYLPRAWDQLTGPGRATYFRGRRGDSFTLCGVAITRTPAARGSWMMAEL
jgi:CubicO group peptidase (beta-lactamase class C family)